MLTNNVVPNRLINEKSPYLLQHAYNPVDWYPWGEEAFAKSKVEDKPIFLSIGYSTCHWCHVMERESFEDADVAEILNRNFISVKVDREERPELDHIYMEVCQALTGSGGWPLSAVLDGEGRPFFAGTYFPKPKFMNLLMRLGEMWFADRERLLDSASSIVQYLETPEAKDDVTSPAIRLDAVANACFDQLADIFDKKYGGFGNAPKFPSPHNLLFLMLYSEDSGNPDAMDMTRKTLEGFYRGGINDHIGGGYARYSTDRSFLVPHFEKMLYDNAMLTLTFSEGFKLTGDIFYRTAAEEIVWYVLRDMTSPEGGFYSAEDADSEGEEGRFYLFSPDEVEEVLGKDDGQRFCSAYDIMSAGNFEEKSIPNLIYGDISVMQNDEFKKMRRLLFEYREKRIHPFKDDKILLGWNGLMIAALAKAGKVLDCTDWLNAAERAFSFAESNMTDGEGKFLSRWRDGEAKYPANGEDLAFLIWGLLELHAAAKKREYLEKAVRLTEEMLADFSDEAGGFFLTGKRHEKLISRPKPLYDGAIPSLNSVMAYNLIRIYLNTGEAKYEETARRSFGAFTGRLEQSPLGQSFLLYAHLYDKTTERVCTEDYCAF